MYRMNKNIFATRGGETCEAQGRRFGYEPHFEHADVWFPAVPFVPHPSTEPAAVFAGQVADVKELTDGLVNWSVELLTAELCLPEWNVRRALHALGRLPAGEWHDKRPRQSAPDPDRLPFAASWPLVRAALGGRSRPVSNVARTLGWAYQRTHTILVAAERKGLVARTPRRFGSTVKAYWSLTPTGKSDARDA